MKKRLTYYLMILYLTVVIVCVNFGGSIRNMLSPSVYCEQLKSLYYNGSVYFILPEDVLIFEINGHPCIWTVIHDDKYREESYIVKCRMIEIIDVNDQKCTMLSAGMEMIVTYKSEKLVDGKRVNVISGGY